MNNFHKVSLLLEKVKDSIPQFKDPKELFNWISDNLKYGWMDKNYKKYNTFGKTWWKHYSLLLPEEVYKYKIGTCFEQTIFANYIFNRDFPKLETKMIFIAQMENKKEANTHTFLLYKYKDKTGWWWFENAFHQFKGIRGPFSTTGNAIDSVKKAMKTIRKSDKFWVTEMNSKLFQKKLTGKEFYSIVKYPYM